MRLIQSPTEGKDGGKGGNESSISLAYHKEQLWLALELFTHPLIVEKESFGL